MTPELHYLALVATFTALTWIPYVLNEIFSNKLSDVVGYPTAPLVLAPWAERLKKAHYNAIENLAPFAAIVLVAHAAGVSNAATAAAAAAYFWARIAHAVCYTLAIPWLRTLSFAVSWGGIICIAWHVLMR
ncbi:MAG TPA: MAPEG family protein [Xanthomonadales bacterium]|nr:MAPEG family protein [Xanthomonadales bacterium]